MAVVSEQSPASEQSRGSEKSPARKTRTGRNRRAAAPPARQVDYRQLAHPFEPQKVFSDDAIANMHNMALDGLEQLGMKMLLPEARALFAKAGAIVDEDSQMVRVGREIVEAALKSLPRSTRMRAIDPGYEQDFKLGNMLFSAGAGCPNVTDAKRGRRPGSIEDFRETIMLQQSFQVIHKLSPSAEPQDISEKLRHLATTKEQMCLASKPMFVWARGQGQTEQSFEMIRAGFELSDEEFTNGVWATTIVNTNSPRQLDVPMAQGIIDFARAGQFVVVTPFCLAGAMAPVTPAGALVLQHLEALGALTLGQLAKPGAPSCYGGFASNVDMKSGSPAFGTPEHIRLSIGSGQLARYIDLPWRSAAGSASNAADMQGGGENHMGLWAALQANATLTVHAAGWLEGGLSFGYEKFINDVEALQTIAELCVPAAEDEDSLGWSALKDVDPGGHFFACEHTMERYDTAFYSPLVADLDNVGRWTKNGAKTSTERSTDIWQSVIDDFELPSHAGDVEERLTPLIEKFTNAGGAPPVGG